jgi:hypothetical protein
MANRGGTARNAVDLASVTMAKGSIIVRSVAALVFVSMGS